MSLRVHGTVQSLIGLALMVVGVAALLAGFELAGMTGRLSRALGEAGDQTGGMADVCQQTLPMLDDLGRTSGAARDSLKATRTSLDEMAKREDEWHANAASINETLGGFGKRVGDVGRALDVPIPIGLDVEWGSKAGIPYPSGVKVKYWDGLQKVAKPLASNGEKLVTLGAAVQNNTEFAITQFERNRKPMSKALDEGAQGLQDVGAAAQSLKDKGVPALVAQMHATQGAMKDVGTHLPATGRFMVLLGIAVLLGGLMCIANGLTFWRLELRFPAVGAKNSAQATRGVATAT